MPSPWMIHDHPALGDRTLTPMEANPRADSDIIQEIVSRSVADIRANRERDKADFVNVVNKWISNGRRGKLFSGKKIKSVATWIQDEWLNNPSFVKEIGRLAGLSPEELEAVTQQGIEEARAQKPVFSIGDEEDNDPRFSLGVPYQGSKNRIAERIIERLPEGRRFVDLFSGGGAMTHAAMLSGKYGRYHMNDINDAGQQLFLQGVRGEWDNYNRTEMTDDEFKAIKGTPEGLVWSYNGLGRNLARPDKNGRDKAAEQIRRVKSLSSLRDKAGDIDASNVDYRGVILHPGDVVYADIPYEGTDQAGYGKGKFNKQAFVEWAQAQDVPIFVSEYTMPEGWVEVESYDVPGMKGGKRTERLWVQDKFAESMVRDDATEQEKSESQVKFSIVEDPEELERLNKGKTVPRYRAMVEIDGKLYPPMSVYADGKLREPTKEGVWERSDETPLTDEQKAAITALEENGETGNVVIIPDKLRYHKSSKKGKGKLQFKLNKDNGDYVWAAYNPYFHTSTSGMNDQFSSAWKRPNLVVVEVEVPESELTDGYQAPYAKDAVGNTPWKSGTVNNALPADRQRTVTLSRYAKVVGKVDDAKVAEGIAEQLKGLDIEVPFNVVTPSLRDELVKHGVKIGPPEKGNAGKAAIPAYEEWLESQGEKKEQPRFSFGGPSSTFKERLEKAYNENGVVASGLNDAEVTAVGLDRDKDGALHPFDETLGAKDLKEQVKNYAVSQGDAILGDADFNGEKINVSITAVREMADPKSIKNSVSKEIHLGAILKIKDIISNSIEVEVHPDYIERDENGKRIVGKYNPNSLIHRLCGAVMVDDVPYAVRILVKEFRGRNKGQAYTYEVANIELPEDHQGLDKSRTQRTTSNSIPVANLLRKAVKSYDDKTFLLKESAKLDEQDSNTEIQNNPVNLSISPEEKDKFKEDEVPKRITSMAQAAKWTYDTLSRIRGELGRLHGFGVESKDFTSGILSDDTSNGRKIDTAKAEAYREWMNEYLDIVQPLLYQARDNSTSNEARKYFEEQIDEANYARQWYDRAAEGDASVLNDLTPLFSIAPEKKEKTERIFSMAKERFGTTDDLNEAGYILPDGTMLDFSGRHQVDEGQDTSNLRGGRTVDHRDVAQLNYEADGNTENGLDVSMKDFIKRGAIRIDANAGLINLSSKPTPEQRRTLQRLVGSKDGYVMVEIGDGWDTEHYGEYDKGTKTSKVLGDIDHYFDEGIRFSIDTDDQGQPYDNGDMPFDEMISKGLADLAQKNKDNVELRVRAMRGIGGNLAKLRQAMSLQRTYDRSTVDSIVRMANMMMGSGIYSGFTPYEVRRLMGMVNRAAGREDITKEADKVVDLMLNHQLKELDSMFKKQLRTKATKIDNNGVEVQAGLDIAGQRMMQALKDGMDLDKDAFNEYSAGVQDRMFSDDEVTARNAAEEWQGVQLAQQYNEEIKNSKDEEKQLRKDMRDAEDAVRAGTMDRQAYNEFVKEMESTLRENKLARTDAYLRMMEALGGNIGTSRQRAKEWQKRELRPPVPPLMKSKDVFIL